MAVTIDDIADAARRIEGTVVKTPLVQARPARAQPGPGPLLKLENLQRTGSFKLRGAANAVARLKPSAKQAGVVTVSTGNHGRGLAHACKVAGVRATICMSNLVPNNKRQAVAAEGAEIRIHGNSQDAAETEALRLVQEQGMTYVPPFDHADIIAGQGTIGLEILSDWPSANHLIVPLSGGGLISGIAVAAKSANPDIRVTGISMTAGPAMHECLLAGCYVEVEELPTLADSLGGGIGRDNQYTFRMVRDLVDDIILVGEDEIARAIRHAWEVEGLMLEGGGSVGIAAVLSGRIEPTADTVIVCSGANIDAQLHAKIVAGWLPERE